MSVSCTRWLSAIAITLLTASPALAVVPYTPVPVFGPPIVGPGVMPPSFVYGKEYSHDFDFSVVGPTPDPEQVINWDGVGGTSDGIDYSGSRLEWQNDQEVDAIANQRDALYDQTIRDESHLTFSHDDVISMYGPGGGLSLFTVPSAGPVFISNGNAIGGAGEVSREEAGAFGSFSAQSVWATQPEVNGMPLPVDVDGTELWGPEAFDEGPEIPFIGDADKYSLDVDTPSGVSVWNASGTPYIPQSMIIGAVTSLLGPMPGTAFSLRDDHQGHQAINLDALMVSDIVGDPDFFDVEPLLNSALLGPESLDQNGDMIEPYNNEGEMRGDSIIFSIRQIVDPADTMDGYYATGSELFVLDALSGASFLFHGGHLWDHSYALGSFAYDSGPDGVFVDGDGVIDINAIEAIGEDQLGAIPPLFGDYNRNGVVDAADYTVWRDSKGATGFGLVADGNSDHVVDVSDYAIWFANFGAIAPSFAVSVPEPTTALLVMVTLIGAGFTRRR